MATKTPTQTRKGKKLEIKRVTVKDLTVRNDVKGGAFPVSMWTRCDACYRTQVCY